MPIYEYKCANCGLFEKFEKITSSPLTTCPTCGGKVNRIISPAGIIFKGSGFYSTDNRSPNYKKDSSKKTSSKKDSSQKDSAQKDSAQKDSTQKDFADKNNSSNKSGNTDKSKAS